MPSLCRKPLPPGPEKLFHPGYRIHATVMGVVDPRCNVSWESISLSPAQREGVDRSRALSQEVAAQGYMHALCRCMAHLSGTGCGQMRVNAGMNAGRHGAGVRARTLAIISSEVTQPRQLIVLNHWSPPSFVRLPKVVFLTSGFFLNTSWMNALPFISVPYNRDGLYG